MKSTQLDTITLTGITAVGYHGVLDFEKRNGQPFVVDVVMHTDFTQAAASDDVAHTADYGQVADRVRRIIESESLNLIETLADRIAAAVLSDFQVQAVEVTVHKPQAPIDVPFGDVAVGIYRARS